MSDQIENNTLLHILPLPCNFRFITHLRLPVLVDQVTKVQHSLHFTTSLPFPLPMFADSSCSDTRVTKYYAVCCTSKRIREMSRHAWQIASSAMLKQQARVMCVVWMGCGFHANGCDRWISIAWFSKCSFIDVESAQNHFHKEVRADATGRAEVLENLCTFLSVYSVVYLVIYCFKSTALSNSIHIIAIESTSLCFFDFIAVLSIS